MRISRLHRPNHAFTALELLVVLAVLFTLFVLLVLPGIMRPQRPDHSVSRCASNVKQITIAFKMFEGDNNGLLPFQTKDSLAYTNTTHAWLHFLSLSNELGSAKILLCPSDRQAKTQAVDFNSGTNAGPQSLPTLKNAGVSYFVNLDAQSTNYDLWLTGDGRLGDVGRTNHGPLLLVNPNSRLRWDQPLHDERPNVALVYGNNHIGKKFTTSAPWPVRTTNRLLLPQ
jgi:competence protein ComGC